MIQKRGHAEEDEDDKVSSSKRSRASTSPAPVPFRGIEGKFALRSSAGKEGVSGHDNNSDNDNDEEEDEDYTSSSGTSSSSSDEDDDDGEKYEDNGEEENQTQHTRNNIETITYIPGRPKPQIRRPANSDLLSRISSFLPQLQAANADIEQRLANGESLEDMILDDVKDAKEEGGEEEGGQYIEMNLGLGVLKEKKKKRQEGDISLGDESASESDEGEEDEKISKGGAEEGGEGQVMNQLMGVKSRSGQKPRTKTGIQEVDEG